jgi:aromatic ring-opening dioxygenase catalytic subunit (LigB family)
MSGSTRLPVIYIPHGGGPWHVMEDAFGDAAGYAELSSYLKGLGERFIGNTRTLLVISAHWEEDVPAVHFGKHPGMLYDYYGFPKSTYSLSWPAPGSPEVAGRVEALLRGAGFATRREEARGYDHGLFVPCMVAFPQADIPVAQLSLVGTLDPDTHHKLGAALEPLRDEGVLIIGSGMSYHNLRGFMSDDPRVGSVSRRFDEWLTEAVTLPDPEQRRRRLVEWRKAPGALECHPRSDHLVPLFVIAGAAGADGGRVDHGQMLMGAAVSSHIFG